MTISPMRHDVAFEIPENAELLIKEARRKGRRRRLKFALLFTVAATLVIAMVVLAVGGIPIGSERTLSGHHAPPTGGNLSSATTLRTTNTYLLYAGNGAGVTATYNLNTGCSEVFLTNDFVHWQDVTPPIKRTLGIPKGQCLYEWTDASFSSPTDGWLLARNGGSDETILRHTTDGGRTWATEPDGDTGSNAGMETIDFVNSKIGWRQQFAFGSNRSYELQRTLNGGATWSNRSAHSSCTFAQDVFSSVSIGFAISNVEATSNPTFLLRTENGGLNWSRLTFPTPPSLPNNARGLYEEPAFVGTDGVEPVDFPVDGHQAIYFYTTRDDGLTWKLDTNSMLPVIVSEPLKLNPETASGACNLDTAATTGRAAAISLASLSTWWILEPGPKGTTKNVVVTGSGRAESTFTVDDLPATTGQMEFSALNVNDALLTRPIPYGYQTTFESTDGGATWRKLKL